MEGWSYRSQVAAAQSILDEGQRCRSCGLSPEDGWNVAAEVHRCPTCEDLDRRRDSIPKTGNEGQRVRFVPLLTENEQKTQSSNAWYTLDGVKARLQARRDRKS